ncbi:MULTISPECIES: hypothetical protein [Psychrobacillus]
MNISLPESKAGVTTNKAARNKCINNAKITLGKDFSFFVTKSEKTDAGTP